MKKLISLLAIIILLVAAPSPSSSRPPSYLDSIRPLNWAEADEPNKPFPHCTTFSINQTEHLWLTAAHCIDNETIGMTTIDGRIVRVVKYDKDVDLAILYSLAFAKDLRLSIHSPEWGQNLHLVGYINGEQFPIILFGRVANPEAKPEQINKPYMIIDGTTGGGMSGGPILAEDDSVVGVTVAGLGAGMGSRVSPITGGITYDIMKEFTNGFWR